MADNYPLLIENCESLLREGRGHLAAAQLSELRVSEIPREHRLPLANICRRMNLLPLGLKILSSLTGPNRVEGVEATGRELAEYAVLLERSGAVREALQVLSEVKDSDAPEVPLYRAFCHFKSWDYEASIPELTSYIARMETPYWKLVGEVNLAAAYVISERYELALEQLARNIESAEAHGFMRLKGNCFELRAQVQFQHRDYTAVRESLNQAEHIFAKEQTLEQFFVQKWKCILQAFEDHDPAPLLNLRSQALERNDWESVREADLFRLQVRFDARLLDHLYFGTPFESYRRRIESFLQRRPESPFYLYGNEGGQVYDLSTGQIDGLPNDQSVSPGKQIHLLMATMLRDLYRPLRVGGVFAEVFPNTRFDIYSSPGRVHQMQFRLRQWLKEAQIPVRLVEHQNTYSLAIDGPCAFKLAPHQSELNSWWPLWNRLQERLPPEGPLTAAQVRELLQLKHSSSKRFLRWAVDNRLLDRQGSNNRSHYIPRAA